MARAMWSGSINFGLVSVPVKAYSATKDHKVHFNELDEHGQRVHHEKVSAKSGKPVDDVKLGYETSKGHYVTFDRAELDELRPESTKTVDVTDFVDLDDIDPIYYQRTYWLGPDGEAASRAYALLVAAMEDQQKVGIGSVVMRNKQYLAAIRPLENVLALATMSFADEVVPQSDIPGVDGTAEPAPRELEMAKTLVESLSGPFEPERYQDDYRLRLLDLIDKKSKGRKIVAAPAEEQPAEVVDLMAALEASLAAAKSRAGADEEEAERPRGRSRARTAKKA
jgi:DNA end-binding protein Ku